MFKDKRVLVAGGTGMVGISLVKMLIEQGAFVRITSLDNGSRAHPQAQFSKLDLTNPLNCYSACMGMDYVFNLLCTKGSPAVTKTNPADYLEPMLLFNTSLLKAARLAGVKRFLYASSVAVYSPAEVFTEKGDIWDKPPSPNDRAGCIAKRVGEELALAYYQQYGWKEISIVRPCNIYGPYDNFDSVNVTGFPALLKRVVEADSEVTIWSDGTAERDFIYCEDAAFGMIQVMEAGLNPTQPINLGCGRGITIRELVETMVAVSGKNLKIVFDLTKPAGDKKRIMDISRARELINFDPKTSLHDGISKTMEWYLANRFLPSGRYNIFNQPSN